MKMKLFAFICVLVFISGCGNDGGSRADIVSGPVETLHFGDGEWHDVTCILSKDNSFLGYSNQKYSGTSEITIIAAFDQEQSFNIEGYDRPNDPEDGNYNQGDNAEIILAQVSKDELSSALEEMGLTGAFELDDTSYYYIIGIDSPDSGYHASYVVSMTTPAKKAFAQAIIDDPAITRARLNTPAAMSEQDTVVTC